MKTLPHSPHVQNVLYLRSIGGIGGVWGGVCVTRRWRLLARPPKLPTGPSMGGAAAVGVNADIVGDGVTVGRSACCRVAAVVRNRRQRATGGEAGVESLLSFVEWLRRADVATRGGLCHHPVAETQTRSHYHPKGRVLFAVRTVVGDEKPICSEYKYQARGSRMPLLLYYSC